MGTSIPIEQYRRAAEIRIGIREFLHRSEDVARRHGLTPQRYQLLLLVKAFGRNATVTTICRGLRIGQSSVTELVNRAESLGLLRRVPVSGDARSNRLRLTELGEQLLAAAFAELGPDRERLVSLLAPFTE